MTDKITKTLALWHEQNRMRDEMSSAMDNQIKAEFPHGTKVCWNYTLKKNPDTGNYDPIKRHGTVTDFYGYGQIHVVTKPGGPKHRIHGYQLEFAE